MCFWKRGGKAKRRKYELSGEGKRGLGYWKWHDSVYLRANRGRVIEAGNLLWADEGDDVRLMGIPDLSWSSSEEPHTHGITVALAFEVDGCRIEVAVELLVFFRAIEKPAYWRSGTYWITDFDMQEVYDKVALGGFDHIDDWLKNLFVTAAAADEGVQRAFRHYAETDQPVQFVRELATALKWIDFSGQPLSNIVSIKVRPMVDTVRAMATVEYDHAR